MNKNVKEKSDNEKIELNESKIFQIDNEVVMINGIYKENITEFKESYNINDKDKKLINIIFKYIFKSLKHRDMKILLKYDKKKLTCRQIKNNKINSLNKDCYGATNIFISKFINICLINSNKLSKFYNSDNLSFKLNLLKIIKLFFLNDFIDEKALELILGLQIFLYRYKENKKSNKIENENQIYLVIDFLLDFCNNKYYQLNDNKKSQIILIIDFVLKFIKKNILINFADICLLSRNKSFLKLIGLCQIASFQGQNDIISILVEVYKFKLNIDFIFDDLSNQFLYNIKEDSILNKTKLLISKIEFLNNIFKKEAPLIKGEIIKNGFYFSDFHSNGITCHPINKFPSEKNGYSLVISFNLMSNNAKSKFTIFSFKNKDINVMTVYLENNILKIKIKKGKKEFELNDKIITNKSYVLWIIQSKAIGNKMIIFLNDNKTIIDKVQYPESNYKINLGCNVNNDNISVDNFVGIIGTFILFNKCLIKDVDDYKNITKLKELKGNYEDIIYVDCKKEWSFIEKDLFLTLNRMSNDIDKIKDIELIISPKSFGNENLIYSTPNIMTNFKGGIYCNYFQNSSLFEKVQKYNFRNSDFLKNNQSFPIYSHNSFFDFLNGHGFLYLQLDLYYLMSIISLKIEEKTKDKLNKKIKIFDTINEEEDFYTYLTNICEFFFFCFDSLNSSNCFNNMQNEMFQREIQNFKYTLIDLVSILCKYNCKIKIYFLMLFCQKINERKYLEYCSFILTYEYHDPNENQNFNAIFSELNHILQQDCEPCQIQNIFLKLIEHDQIYLNENINKYNKSDYSKLIRLLLNKAIQENLNECIIEYKKRLKRLKSEFESLNSNLLNDISNIQEEDYNIGSEKPSNKPSIDSTNCNEINIIKDPNSRKESYNRRESRGSSVNSGKSNDKNLQILILIYKYLKNLYIGINDEKHNFFKLFEDEKVIFSEFFNEIFFVLEKIYPIQNKYSESEKKLVTIAEYIKCMCIRFLDDFFFEDNYKIIKDEEDKLKNRGEELEDLDNRSTGNLKRSNNSAQTLLKPKLFYSKGNLQGSFVGTNSSKNLLLKTTSSNNASFISNFNIANNTIEEILTRQMEFFENFLLSQYSFRSLFLMLFRNYPNSKKIKFIKGKKENEHELDFILSINDFSKIRYLLKVILLLLERLNSDDIDTCFMNKKQLIEYTFTIISDLLKKNLENYLKKDKISRKKEKSKIKSLFINKKSNCYADRFYKIIIANISSINEDYNELLIKLENSMKEIIKDSIFDLKDPYYFDSLREIFFEQRDMNELVFNLEIFMMEIVGQKISKNEKNYIVEINCKNILILLFKTIFYVNKRNILLANDLFLKAFFLFISEIMDYCSIIYTKILFPIEIGKGKLLIEIIFEIIFEFYLEYLRNPKIKSLQYTDSLLTGLFNENKLRTNLGADTKHFSIFKDMYDKEEDFTPFYIMDLMSDLNYDDKMKNNIKISKNIIVNKYFFELRAKLIKRYKNEIKISNNYFSSCILFAIKILLSIKELHEFYSNNKNTLSPTYSSNSETNTSEGKNKEITDNCIDAYEDSFMKELKNKFIDLCKNIKRIHKECTGTNPFKSMGYYSKNIYEHFRSFIIDKLDFNNSNYMNKIYELIETVNNYTRDLKFFMRVIYTKEGRTKANTEKNYKQIISNLNSDKIIIEKSKKQDTESNGGENDNKSGNSSFSSKSGRFNFKSYNSEVDLSSKNSFNKGIINNDFYLNINTSRSQTALFKKPDLLNKINSDKNDNKIIYESRIKFKKDLMRNYFSLFFGKLLTYDEDFINIKKLFTLTYHREIDDIDKYKNFYPIRIKNYIANNYDKIFLKRDFDFFTDGYFKYSHNYIYNKKYKYNYIFQNKLLFPNKKLIRENDCLDREIFSKNISDKIAIYDCEMITAKGSIFGNIYVFDNCLLFKSDVSNDKRKILKNTEKNYAIALLYACCTIEYDFLAKKKRIIMEYNNIKEIINRTFAYNWIALEIFLKDGRSFLFNLFNEETISDFFEVLKRYKVPVIRKLNDFFKKEEFSKKWKEGKITTYDYLLLLNKYSSRSYNDTNQYPIMPWLFLEEGIKNIRNFDLPISVQDEETQEFFLTKGTVYLANEDSLVHGNHYSTSAYMCFYLMRTNPFTNIMIRFQSNNFDVPDRQYIDMKQTIILCQSLGNNREMIPELFSMPEIYINLNDNDFGKQKAGLRVHNISFQPYAENPFEFCYLIKDLLNNNEEINSQINKWFDFIFGVNQLGNFSLNKNISFEEREKCRKLRKFNTYSYAKLFNYKKIVLEAQKHCKNNKKLYDEIRSSINLVTSFGQCPYQLLSEVHIQKTKYMSNSLPSKSSHKYITNIFDEIFSNYKNDIHNIMNYNKKIKDITIPKEENEIIFFTKSSNNNYLYCLLKNGSIIIYKFDTKIEKNFVREKIIQPKCQFLSLKEAEIEINSKIKTKIQVFQSKYLFCELNENSFIFARTLDKTLIYHNFIEDNFCISFLLKSYITAIISIKNNEFITGSDNGQLCKWKINIDVKGKKANLELLLIVKSNKTAITSLYYDERLSVIVSTDINTLAIRKIYDFEYLNSISIKKENNKNKYITDVKISDFNFIYILIYVEDGEEKSFELHGYTINGTYFGKYKGLIYNFQISKTGKIIVNVMDKAQLTIKVLDPVKFNEINWKEIITKGSSFYFYFERPNIIYYGIKDDEGTKIKIMFLYPEEKNIFYINETC